MKRIRPKSIIISIIILLIIVIFLIVIQKAESMKRAQEFSKYENLRKATVEEIVKYCDIEYDNIDKIRLTIRDAEKKDIGYDMQDGRTGVRIDYYFNDGDFVNELKSKLKDMMVYGIIDQTDVLDDYECKNELELKFYEENKEYSLVMRVYSIKECKNEVLRINIEHSGAGSVVFNEFPKTSNLLWSEFALIYDEKLIDYIYELREKYVTNIKTEDILKIYDEGNNEKFFEFENGGMKNNEEYVMFSDDIMTHLYTFPIDDFEGYIVIEKQNEGENNGSGQKDTADNYISYTDIVAIEICKNSGEKIDFMKASRIDVEDFLKAGD